jgi:hypothetical protein
MTNACKDLKFEFHNPNTSEELAKVLINMVAESMYDKVINEEFRYIKSFKKNNTR